MKKFLMWCLVGLLALGSAAWSQAQTTSGTEKAILALEEEWVKAQNTNNPDLLAPLLADKYVSTSSEGKVTGKAEALAQVKSYVKNSVMNTEVKVIVYGDTAIAYGGWKAKMSDSSGKVTEMYERWTDTWVKMPNGKWQCVADHGSPAKM